jgi:hypothetical protein
MSDSKAAATKEKKSAPASPKKPAAAAKPAAEKKAALKKSAAPKKAAPKKVIKAAAKAKVSKKGLKPKATKSIKKPKTKASKKGGSGGASTKYEKWAAEAIAALATPEKEYVSVGKVKQYILDYFEAATVKTAPKLTKTALALLQTKKLLKSKKDSYAFTAKGKESVAPSKVEKRQKIVRAEPKKKKVVAKAIEKPEVKTVVTISGRTSRSRF